MKLRPGLEIKGPCCRGWHVLYQPDGHEHDSTAARGFLYWRWPEARWRRVLWRHRRSTRLAAPASGRQEHTTGV